MIALPSQSDIQRAGLAADRIKTSVLVALVLMLPAIALWSIMQGRLAITPGDVVSAHLAFDGSRIHVIVQTIRVPRVLAGLLAGAALAVAGAIMQAMTNNPLASPGLFGVNAGAAFAVVMAMSVLGVDASAAYVWYAFAGAALAGAAVLALGTTGKTGPGPARLALAGAVIAAFLTALTTSVLIFDVALLDHLRLWTAGSLGGRSMPTIAPVMPYIVIGLLAAFFVRHQVMTLSLGIDTARSLGQSPLLWRGLCGVIVVLLAGGAVSIAGPVGFVGLVVPHIVRMLVGVDYRWIIPFSAVAGALLLVVADAVGRSALEGVDVPVGVTMAFVGAPFFLYLARYRLGRSP